MPMEARPLVVEWVERVRSLGIRSIVSLLDHKQHEKHYRALDLHPKGLHGYYQSQGFCFVHIPLTDYQPPSDCAKRRVLEAYDRMPKPVLIHCSAGIDRTSPIAAHIVREQIQE